MTALGKHRIFFTAVFLFFGITIIGIGRVNPLFISLGLILFLASIIGTALFEDESDNISAWKRLGLGTAKTYPKDKEEWELLFQSRWTERILASRSWAATLAFDSRDQYKILSAFSRTGIKDPKDFKDLRKRKKELKKILKQSMKKANQLWKKCLEIWDLFKKNGALPERPGTAEQWDNPDTFRKAVEESIDSLYEKVLQIEEPHRLSLINYRDCVMWPTDEMKPSDREHIQKCDVCMTALSQSLKINELLL